MSRQLCPLCKDVYHSLSKCPLWALHIPAKPRGPMGPLIDVPKKDKDER